MVASCAALVAKVAEPYPKLDLTAATVVAKGGETAGTVVARVARSYPKLGLTAAAVITKGMETAATVVALGGETDTMGSSHFGDDSAAIVRHKYRWPGQPLTWQRREQ